MASIIERLTEGVVNRDMRAEGHALLSKWERTGLLEGLDNDRQKNSMARLLENQAKELLREASTLAAGDVEGFAAVAFPIVRRVFAGLIANDLVSVQPMSLPSGLIFFLDFVFSPDAGGVAAGGNFPRMGNTSDKSIYGSDQVGSQITGGVDLVSESTLGGFSGPLRDGAVGYAYASPSGSNSATLPADANVKTRVFLLDGSVSDADAKKIRYDADLLALTDSSLGVVVIDAHKSNIVSTDGDPDFDNLSAFVIANLASADVSGLSGSPTITQVRRLTAKVAAADAMTANEAIRFVFTATGGDCTETAATNLAVAIAAADVFF